MPHELVAGEGVGQQIGGHADGKEVYLGHHERDGEDAHDVAVDVP